MQTRPRVGYIDLLETQIKKERNTAEKEGEMPGQSGSFGHWPHAAQVLILVLPAPESPSCGGQRDFFLG